MERESGTGNAVRRILIGSTRGLLGSEVQDRLNEIKGAAPGFEVNVFDNHSDLEAAVRDAEIVAAIGLTPAALARAGHLQWFHDWSAGVDRVLSEEFVASPVVMTCSKGNGAVSLAEHAMMLMLMLNADAPHYFKAQQAREWSPRFRCELNGMTVGIIGLGNSGADLAGKCKAFHMRVLGLRRTLEACRAVDELFTHDQLHQFLGQSDFVVVTAPLTPLTRNLLGAAELRAMKPTAYLVVVSRGGIVNDTALASALNEGWIAGAGLDAHTAEPLPPGSPFWDTPKTIITPHAGALSTRLGARAVDIFVANLRSYVGGQPLCNIVDKRAGY